MQNMQKMFATIVARLPMMLKCIAMDIAMDIVMRMVKGIRLKSGKPLSD